jgi:hypothetical protein
MICLVEKLMIIKMKRNILPITVFILFFLFLVVMVVNIRQCTRDIINYPSHREVIDSLNSKEKQINYELDSIKEEADTIGVIDSAVNLLDW